MRNKSKDGVCELSGVVVLYCSPRRLPSAFVCLLPNVICLRFGDGFAESSGNRSGNSVNRLQVTQAIMVLEVRAYLHFTEFIVTKSLRLAHPATWSSAGRQILSLKLNDLRLYSTAGFGNDTFFASL